MSAMKSVEDYIVSSRNTTGQQALNAIQHVKLSLDTMLADRDYLDGLSNGDTKITAINEHFATMKALRDYYDIEQAAGRG